MPKVIIISDQSECPSVGQNLNRVWSISPILLAARIPNSCVDTPWGPKESHTVFGVGIPIWCVDIL